MRKFLVALLALLVLLIAAILVGPSLIDWNSQKGRIAAEVRELTGRELLIAGDISLTLLPIPALTAEDVRLANVDGGAEEPMVALKQLRVRIALLPLLEGLLQVQQIVLVEPRILLEVLPDGRANWSFEKAAAAAAGAGGGDLDVRFDDFTVENGTLIYRDATSGIEETVGGLSARIVAESLRGPFAGKGRFSARNLAVAFEGTVGRLADEGATPFNVLLKLDRAEARLRASGALSMHPETVALRAKFKGEGDNLARLAAAVSGSAGAPPGVLAKDFLVQGELSADSQAVSVSQLELRFGTTQLTGSLTSLAEAPYEVQVSLAAPRLDLDRLFEAADGQDAAAEAPPADAGAARGGAPFALPADLVARLEIGVEALIYRGQLVRQLRLEAGLAEGELRLERASMLLPGSSDLSLSGSLTAVEGKPRFHGRLEAASDNLRGLFEWVGAEVGQVPPDRLRRMSLSARIEGGPDEIAVSDLDLRVDLSRISGGIVIAPRARPGLGVGLAIDALDLDAYLPGPAAADGGTAAEAEEAAPEAAGGGMAVLDLFDANLSLRAGAVTLADMTAKDLQLDATLQNGVLHLRNTQIGDLAGGQLSFAGSVEDIPGRPRLDGTLQLSINEPARLARLLDLRPEELAGLPGFTVTGRVKGNARALELNGQATAAGGRLGLSGSLRPSARPPSFDLRLSAQHPEFADLVDMLAGPMPNSAALGNLDLSARVSGTVERIEVDELAGNLGPARLAGSLVLGRGATGPEVGPLDLTLEVSHPDLAQLAALAGAGGFLRPDVGGLELSARLLGASGIYEVENLGGRIAETPLSGRLSVDTTGPRPTLTAQLETGELPLGALFAGAGEAAGGASAGNGQRWSREPIDFTALRALDGEVTLQSKAISKDAWRLEGVVLEAALDDGLLDLRRLTGSLGGGALQLAGKLDARGRPQAGLTLSASEADLGALLPAGGGFDRVSGPVSLDAELTAQGNSEAELVAALGGRGTLSGTLRVRAEIEEQLGGLALGVLGAQLPQTGGAGDALLLLLSGFAGRPAQLEGNFDVTRGVVETQDLKLTGQGAAAVTRGTVALPAWTIDTVTEVEEAGGQAARAYRIGLRGPLDAPRPRLEGLKKQDGGEGTAPKALPIDPLGVQPEKLIEGVIEGLGG